MDLVSGVIDLKGLWMINKQYRLNYTSIFLRENSSIGLDLSRKTANKTSQGSEKKQDRERESSFPG